MAQLDLAVSLFVLGHKACGQRHSPVLRSIKGTSLKVSRCRPCSLLTTQSTSSPYANRMEPLFFPMSPRAPDQSLSRDILALALSQGALDELPMVLTRAAYNPHTSVQRLAQMMALLERVGVDISDRRAAIARTGTIRHCARCHKLYRDQENGPSSCVIYHEAPDARGDSGECDASRSCSCRGIVCTFNSCMMDKRECYRGWHTDDRSQVDYVSSSAIPCEDNHCIYDSSALPYAIRYGHLADDGVFIVDQANCSSNFTRR